MRGRQEHRVKSWMHLFQPVAAGRKFHDIRIMDRGFQVGDIIVLCEFNRRTGEFTGRELACEITYITSNELQPTHTACALSPQALQPNYGVLSIIPVGGMIIPIGDVYVQALMDPANEPFPDRDFQARQRSHV